MRPGATIVDALVARARDEPDRLAYVVEQEPITYGRLLDDARALAGHFVRAGVEPGDRCAFVLPTDLDLIRGIYAAQLCRAVPVVVNPELTVDALTRRLALCDPKIVFTQSDARTAVDGYRLLTTIDEIARQPRAPIQRIAVTPDDLAFLQFTSGTSGDPRLAMISHRNVMASLATTASRLGLHRDDVLATWVPVHHDLGLVRYVFGALVGGCVSHLVRPSMRNLAPWLQLVTRVGATITGGPDSAYRVAALTVDPTSVDLRTLRFAGNGGETVRLDTITRFEARFARPGVVRPAYGLAEATLTVASTAEGEALRVDESGNVSCGRALDGIDVRIADAGGRPVAPGQTGDILIRGAAVFEGYFHDPDATRDALRDGWLLTGDLGAIDADGYLFLHGRSRALIKRGGVTIVPRDLEDPVHRIAGVRAAAALGVALSPVAATEEVVMVVEVDADAAGTRLTGVLDEVDRAVRDALGSAAARILLVAVDTLPRAAGKIAYAPLRQMVVDDAFGPRLLARR